MRLSIENTGKISKADIEINNITVIAGENNTGKSTVGKILFCIFNSFYKIDDRIEAERKSMIRQAINRYHRTHSARMAQRRIANDISEQIIENKNLFSENQELLKAALLNFYTQSDKLSEKYISDEILEKVSEQVLQIIDISDKEIRATVLGKKLEAEFNMQINNIYEPNTASLITLEIGDTKINVCVKNDKDIEIENGIILNTEVVYMDDPFALDDLAYLPFYYGNYTSHREHLITVLSPRKDISDIKGAMDEIIATKNLDEIFEKLNSVCSGEIIDNSNSNLLYKEKNSEMKLEISNISTGLKTFVILKTLLQNGSIEENGTIILDEPEIHLHPEWQLIFAELIVLIQQKFNMHILINTHSHYFLKAIDVYSRKHGISEKCKYYLAENSGKVANITDVSDKLEAIYAKYANPLKALNEMRDNNDD